MAGTEPRMDINQVRCLAAERRSVIDDFKLNLFAGVVDDWHARSFVLRSFNSREMPNHRLDFFSDAWPERPIVVQDG